MLMASFVLAPDGQQILMQQIERIRGDLGTPLIDFFFVPMPVEPKRRVELPPLLVNTSSTSPSSP